jgi:hypothetical protein
MREASTNVLSKAAVSARSHVNTTRRSARTAKDHTKRDRKSALKGELADRLVCGEQTEILSSPPVMEMKMEMEQDDLLDVDGQTGTETMQSDQERTVSAEINAISVGGGSSRTQRRNTSLPRLLY